MALSPASMTPSPTSSGMMSTPPSGTMCPECSTTLAPWMSGRNGRVVLQVLEHLVDRSFAVGRQAQRLDAGNHAQGDATPCSVYMKPPPKTPWVAVAGEQPCSTLVVVCAQHAVGDGVRAEARGLPSRQLPAWAARGLVVADGLSCASSEFTPSHRMHDLGGDLVLAGASCRTTLPDVVLHEAPRRGCRRCTRRLRPRPCSASHWSKGARSTGVGVLTLLAHGSSEVKSTVKFASGDIMEMRSRTILRSIGRIRCSKSGNTFLQGVCVDAPTRHVLGAGDSCRAQRRAPPCPPWPARRPRPSRRTPSRRRSRRNQPFSHPFSKLRPSWAVRDLPGPPLDCGYSIAFCISAARAGRAYSIFPPNHLRADQASRRPRPLQYRTTDAEAIIRTATFGKRRR